ncbi:MAG: sugar transferase [Gordonibacter pamelaeae]
MQNCLDNRIAETGDCAVVSEECFDEGQCETASDGICIDGANRTGHMGYRIIKRAFDIVFSLVVIVVGLLPIVLLCLVVRLESPGSPIYRQERVGYCGRPLHIFKLHTMVSDSDEVEKYLTAEQLAQWKSERKVENDPRITRVGRFLRKTSLDELPKFLNVLVGSMSIVGPRPVVEDELAAYGSDVAVFLSAKPGITGWWQVQARNDATYEDGSRQELELYYVRNASLSLDAKVFFGTFRAMFGRTGK